MANKPNWCFLSIAPDFKIRIDRRDREAVANRRWRIYRYPDRPIRIVTTAIVNGKKTQLSLSALIMDPKRGESSCQISKTDERDFRRSNLANVTRKGRQQLVQKKRRGGTSKFKGVSLGSSGKKWRAQIEVDGRAIYLGEFTTEKAAALAYDRAAIEYFGNLAVLNYVPKPTKS